MLSRRMVSGQQKLFVVSTLNFVSGKAFGWGGLILAAGGSFLYVKTSLKDRRRRQPSLTERSP